MIKYYRLFDLLNRKGMKKTDLLKVISSPTLAKLSKGEVVKTDIIDKICLYLECQPGDIMECLYGEEEIPGLKARDIKSNKEIILTSSIITEKPIINELGESENIVEIREGKKIINPEDAEE